MSALDGMVLFNCCPFLLRSVKTKIAFVYQSSVAGVVVVLIPAGYTCSHVDKEIKGVLLFVFKPFN